jgi:hypothetical protein
MNGFIATKFNIQSAFIYKIGEKKGLPQKVAEVRLVRLLADGKISGRKISSGGQGVWVWWIV